MPKLSIIAAIFMLVAANANVVNAWAEDDGIVRMRLDGRLIDPFGKIIAIPAKDDTRNNEYRKYYKSLDENGRPSQFSDFYLITDTVKGMMKIPVGEEPPVWDDEGVAAPARPSQPVQNGMVTQYDGSQTLIKTPDAPIYNDVNNTAPTVY